MSQSTPSFTTSAAGNHMRVNKARSPSTHAGHKTAPMQQPALSACKVLGASQRVTSMDKAAGVTRAAPAADKSGMCSTTCTATTTLSRSKGTPQPALNKQELLAEFYDLGQGLPALLTSFESRSCCTATAKRQASPSLDTNKQAYEASTKVPASTDCKSSNTSQCSRVVPALPLKSLTSCPDDMYGMTPTLTPHTLTDNALRKSELLIAELTALGFSDEDEASSAENNAESQNANAGSTDALCMNLSTQPLASSETPVLPGGRKRAETVEVPVVLLDLFSETFTKHHKLQSAHAVEAMCRPEKRAPRRRTSFGRDLWKKQEAGYQDLSKIFLSDLVTSDATLPGCSMSVSSTMDDSCSAAGFSMSVPSTMDDSCSATGTDTPTSSVPQSFWSDNGMSSTPDNNEAKPSSVDGPVPCSVSQQRGTGSRSVSRQRTIHRASRPLVQTHPQVRQHVSPQLPSPCQASRVRRRMQTAPAQISSVAVDIPQGCKSCTIQQTFTVTSTFYFDD